MIIRHAHLLYRKAASQAEDSASALIGSRAAQTQAVAKKQGKEKKPGENLVRLVFPDP